LEGRRFVSIEEIQAESQQVRKPLMPAGFYECFQKWRSRWDRCIQTQGDYFEDAVGNLDLMYSFNICGSVHHALYW